MPEASRRRYAAPSRLRSTRTDGTRGESKYVMRGIRRFVVAAVGVPRRWRSRHRGPSTQANQARTQRDLYRMARQPRRHRSAAGLEFAQDLREQPLDALEHRDDICISAESRHVVVSLLDQFTGHLAPPGSSNLGDGYEPPTTALCDLRPGTPDPPRRNPATERPRRSPGPCGFPKPPVSSGAFGESWCPPKGWLPGRGTLGLRER